MNKILIERDECKRIQVEILEKVAEICVKNDIEYYIQYGSLLGAVRHKGFIPWDDDIDIILARNDYERLLKILKDKTKNGCEWLDILDSSIEGYYYTFAKVVDNRTKAKMDSNITEHGIWVDIFPIDGLPDSMLKSKIHIEFCYFLRGIVLAMTTDFSSKRLGKKIVYKLALNAVASIIGKNRICKLYEKVCRKYDVTTAKWVANLFSPYRIKERFEKDMLFQGCEYAFENRRFVGPREYDMVLKQLYGEYMKLPPVEKRRTHSITAWYV